MKKDNLDPKEWNNFGNLGKEMIDDMVEYYQSLYKNETRVWKNAPNNVKENFKKKVPKKGCGELEVYKQFKEDILKYSLGNTHPRFWGWVCGSGIPLASLSDMLASMINPLSGVFNQSGMYVETQVIDWFKDIMGYPLNSSGLMVSGGSMSNFIGLNVARDWKAKELGVNLREDGMQSLGKRLIFYCSTETHSCIEKNIQILGLGSNSLRKIEVNLNYEINIKILAKIIEEDIEKGYIPTCIIGTIGTTGTGAIDNILELSKIAKKNNLWFHIDGTFGSLVKLSNKYKKLANYIELSDSLSLDFHKWLHIPYEAAIVLVKDEKKHFNTYNINPDYFSKDGGGILVGENRWLTNYGPQLARGFKALKVWMCISAYGIDHFGKSIENNINQAQYLTKCIKKESTLLLMSPTSLNIVCYRYFDKKLSEKELNVINMKILHKLQSRGIAMPSNKILNNKFCIRVSITNHRSRIEDFDLLIKETLSIAKEFL